MNKYDIEHTYLIIFICINDIPTSMVVWRGKRMTLENTYLGCRWWSCTVVGDLNLSKSIRTSSFFHKKDYSRDLKSLLHAAKFATGFCRFTRTALGFAKMTATPGNSPRITSHPSQAQASPERAPKPPSLHHLPTFFGGSVLGFRR